MENMDMKSDQSVQFDSEQKVKKAELKSAWQLLKEAWHLYGLKFKTAIGIIAVPVIISIVLKELNIASVSYSALSQSVWASILKIIIWCVYLYFNAISISALLFSIKDNIAVKGAYIKAVKTSPAYLLVIIIMLLATTGGTMLFIIPGIIFSIWFCFSIYTFVFEEKRGMNALYRSKQLVAGNFWKIVWSILFILIILTLASVPFYFIEKNLGNTRGFMIDLFRIFSIPLATFFFVSLFQNLVQIKGDVMSEGPSKAGKFWIYFSMLIAIPIVLVFMLLSGLSLMTHDIPNPDDSDLRLSVVDVSKEHNAYYALMETKDTVFWPDEDYEKIKSILKGGEWDQAFVDNTLQKNQQALASFEKGVTFSIFQIPELQDPKDLNFNFELTSLNSLRSLAQLNSLQALSFLKQGQEKGAFDQSMKTIKVAQMLHNGQNGAIGYLMGLAIKEIGLSNFRSLVESSHMSSAELLGYSAELDGYISDDKPAQRIIRGEYMMNLIALNEINKGLSGGKAIENDELMKGIPSLLVGNSYFFKLNKTKLININISRRQLENVGKKNYSEIEVVEYREPIYWKIIFTENAIGEILSEIRGSSFDGLYAKRFEEVLSVRGTQLLLALKAYKQDTGNLPNSLQELVPKYIPEPVQDPFDGKEMKYSSEKKIIYSTGEDLVDNGGAISEEDWKKGDDLGFKIEF